MLAVNKLENLRRRVDRARKFPVNTCPASRHLHLIAEALATGRPYPMLIEEPEHCAGSMLSVLESLWKARTHALNHRRESHETYRAKNERLPERVKDRRREPGPTKKAKWK